MADGNLTVPCSRYGTDTASCAPVAHAVAAIIAAETTARLDAELLDYAMGLVVNDHDDVAHLLREYGSLYGFNADELLAGQS